MRRALTPLLLVAGCSTPLHSQVEAVLDQRGLGADALHVIDNVLRHGASAPRAAPPIVREILADPLAAADAAQIFERTVPALLRREIAPAAGSFDELLAGYLKALEEAQHLLRGAVAPFDDAALLDRLEHSLPESLAIEADAAQLERANALFLEATLRFARSIREVPAPRRFQSPIGTVIIGGTGNDRYGPGAALIIDPGGDDLYERATARDGRIAVVIDLGGNDRYTGADVALRGFSAIVDLAGDDRYEMRGPGLGAAIGGAALLADFAGDDVYEAGFFAQGAAAYGIGALLDFAGDDRYRIRGWGQGFGFAGGVGLLWDRGGDDLYLAAGERDAYQRGGALSGAQGVGFGHRGLLAGGVGILRDDAGDDLYEAQLFAQGTGYYYGLGMLWDRGGNDRYRAIRYAQGNGVHEAVGILRDESGDDAYAITLGYGQGMGLDLGVGALVDAAGDDLYRAHYGAQGAATANGFGLLVDRGGVDRFELGADDHAWGRAEWLRGLPSVGVLLHGEDAAFTRDGKRLPAGPPGGPLGGSPVAVEPPVQRCRPDTPWPPDESLLCRLRDAQPAEALFIWDEVEKLLASEPGTSHAVFAAVALRLRPPEAKQAARVANLLQKDSRCTVRALALRAWPSVDAAREGLRSDCWRLQAAAQSALARLGAPADPGAALPSFLRGSAPQDESF